MVKVQIDKFTQFLKSSEVQVVGSAIFVTPLILGVVNRFGGNLPLVGGNIWIVFLIASFVVFGIASQVSGIIKNILLGVSVGLLINAVLSGPLGKYIAPKLRSLTS